MIAKPFSPGNAFPAEEVARERITFDKAMIGSCTNGSYDDLLQAALVLRAAREQGVKRVQREFAIFPGSGGVGRQIETPDPRLGGESIADVFRSVGGGIRQSWCGPCFGQGPDSLRPGQRAITSFNRNWQNRMGFGRRRISREPVRGGRVGPGGLHGSSERARPALGRGSVRSLSALHHLATPARDRRPRRPAAGGPDRRRGDRPFDHGQARRVPAVRDGRPRDSGARGPGPATLRSTSTARCWRGPTLARIPTP